MHLGTYNTPCKYYSFRRKASLSTTSKGFTFIRRLVQPPQWHPHNSLQQNFRDHPQMLWRWKPIASSLYPVITCYPEPLPTTSVATLHPNTQYSFSRSRRNTVWCTQHAIQQPQTIRSVEYRKSLDPWLERTSPRTKEYKIPVYTNTSPSRKHNSTSHM